MGLSNTPTSWGWASRLLHWVSAGVILFLLGLGFYMVEVLSGTDSETLLERFALTQTHKSWGFVAFALVALRMIWRAMNPTPALPDGMSGLERAAAHGGHIALYACMIAMPISGWLMASASPLQDTYGIKNMVFGLFELPDPFVPGSSELDETLKAVHFYTALALIVLMLVHIGAALKHAFVNKDGVLRRMITG